MKKNLLIVVISLVISIVIGGAIVFRVPISLYYAINKKQKVILYDINHSALSRVTRDLVWPKNEPNLYERFGDQRFDNSDPRIPDALWIANPGQIFLMENRIDFDYGGAFMRFGLRVFPVGEEGYGTLNLGEGIWFYSGDGRYPKKR